MSYLNIVLLVISIFLTILVEKFSSKVQAVVRMAVHKFFLINFLYYFFWLFLFFVRPFQRVNNMAFFITYISSEVVVNILKRKGMIQGFFNVPETHPAYEYRQGVYKFLTHYGLLYDAIVTIVWFNFYFIITVFLY